VHLAQGQTLGVLAGEELLVRTRGRDPLERRVGNEIVDLVVDHDPGLPANLGELHCPRILRRQIPRQ
jgi:hypothetical protein